MRSTNYPAPPPALRIKDLKPDEQPRERLLHYGPRGLTDAEILAILIGSGTQGFSALDVARHLLRSVNHDLHELARYEVTEFRRQKGIGQVRAIRLVAALELGRRREAALIRKKRVLNDSEDCYHFLRPLLADLNREVFYVLCLNRGNRLVASEEISTGGVSGTVADAKLIFKAALRHGGVTSLVLGHNHPSGQAFPSAADIRLTEKLYAGALNLDLCVLDHIIVAGQDYYSFADEGRLGEASSRVVN